MTGVAARLNAMADAEAREALRKCCACESWIAQVLAGRPYASDEALYTRADSVWGALSPVHWIEAFSAHPRIGGAIRQGSATAAWSSQEQAGAARSGAGTSEALRVGNVEYERKFGHVFLICATGKSGEEMLAALRDRLHNDAETELRIAAAEQAKITRLRLARLVEP